MPRVQRRVDVAWEGNLARGSGELSAQTGAFHGLPFSLASRVAQAEGKTSPEELLAAAHAGCWTMSLAGELTGAGTPPERLTVAATTTLDEVEGAGHRIVASDIHARARVPGIDRAEFERAVEAADAGCPFSALIRASATVSVDAELEEAGV
ncbi:MAG: OsmC family peroxiredoxin [Actinobacteria bacterium]|nr:OsmC family peroxiredoxin [Actinomycetota bacterium]